MLIYCQEILFGLKTQYNGLGLKCDSSKLFPCRGGVPLKVCRDNYVSFSF